MRKLKLFSSLLMISALFILITSVPVRAEEIADNNTNKNGIVETAAASSFSTKAKITGDGVRIRKTPSYSGTVLGMLYKGDKVKVDVVRTAYPVINGSMTTWYYCKTESGIVGYIYGSYVQFL